MYVSISKKLNPKYKISKKCVHNNFDIRIIFIIFPHVSHISIYYWHGRVLTLPYENGAGGLGLDLENSWECGGAMEFG